MVSNKIGHNVDRIFQKESRVNGHELTKKFFAFSTLPFPLVTIGNKFVVPQTLTILYATLAALVA